MSMLIIICVVFSRAIAAWQLKYTGIEESGLVHGSIYFNKFRSDSALDAVFFKVINSDSIVNLAIHVCLVDFQEIAALPRLNTYPLVDLILLLPRVPFASHILLRHEDNK